MITKVLSNQSFLSASKRVSLTLGYSVAPWPYPA